MVTSNDTEERIAALEREVQDLRAQLSGDDMTTAINSPIPVPPKGTPISLNQASVKYGVASKTLGTWRDLGEVSVLEAGNGRRSRCLVDEHDVVVAILNRANRPGRGIGRKAREKLGLPA